MVNCIRPINILNKLIFLIIVYVWNDISMYILLLREDRNISSVERRVFFPPQLQVLQIDLSAFFH